MEPNIDFKSLKYLLKDIANVIKTLTSDSCLIMAAIIIVLAGCISCGGGEGHKSCQEAYSLLFAPCKSSTDADSAAVRAMDILNHTDPKRLNASDNAYRDVLIVYARYRLSDELTHADDSIIDHAITILEKQGSNTSLTLAYAVKGIVCEDIGDIESDNVLRAFQLAKVGIDTTQSSLAGFVNIRFANYLQSHSSIDTATMINHYRVAKHFYSHINDKLKVAQCDYCLSFLYGGTSFPDSCEYFANEALTAGHQLGDSVLIVDAYNSLSGIAFEKGAFRKAIAYADSVELIGSKYDYGDRHLYFKSASLCKLGLPDSARSVANRIEQADTTSFLDIQMREFIAEASGDYKTAFRLLSKQYEIRDNEVGGAIQQSMVKAKTAFENEQLAIKNADKSQTILILSLVVFVLLIIVVVFTFARKLKNEQIRYLLSQIGDKNNEIRIAKHDYAKIINDQLDSLLRPIRNVEDYDDTMKFKRSAIRDVQLFVNGNFMSEAEKYVNSSFNNIVADLRHKVKLTDKEAKVLILTCCGRSPAEIALFLDYYNKRSVSNLKAQIAAKVDKKLTLNQIIESYLVGEPFDANLSDQ